MNKVKEIEKLRKEIDNINQDLLKTIARRFKVTDKIKKIKVKNNLPAEDKNRELEIMDRSDKLAKKLNIDSQLARDILRMIIEAAKR